LLWFLFGYNNEYHFSLFDNRVIYHICGSYAVSHIFSLFSKKYYWTICPIIAIMKEMLDHFVFGCGNNEFKHFTDILTWSLGGISYWIIVKLKRKRFGYKA
jgi:hypothetical protein